MPTPYYVLVAKPGNAFIAARASAADLPAFYGPGHDAAETKVVATTRPTGMARWDPTLGLDGDYVASRPLEDLVAHEALRRDARAAIATSWAPLVLQLTAVTARAAAGTTGGPPTIPALATRVADLEAALAIAVATVARLAALTLDLPAALTALASTSAPSDV